MGAFAGIAVVFVMVFGGYIMAGGEMGVILHALPHEMVVIGGAALGAFLIANTGPVAKKTMKDLGKIKGSKWKKQDYMDLLCLLFLLTKTMKTKGVIAIEAHIENPHESNIFNKYPRISHDHFALDLICDTLRMMTMNLEDPHQVEDLIERQIEKHHHEAAGPAHAMQAVADGLPALGIVAAVLGIIKTMGSIDKPPTILGAMIGGALVGTFMGVFLAYGFAGPISSKLTAVYDEEGVIYHIIKNVLVAYLNGNAAQVAVEIGRTSIPSHLQPKFAELEEAINNAKVD